MGKKEGKVKKRREEGGRGEKGERGGGEKGGKSVRVRGLKMGGGW